MTDTERKEYTEQTGTLTSQTDTDTKKRGFETFTSEQLFSYQFSKQDFIVNNLLRPGLAVLAGSPKIGKSWLVLHLCMQVAKGETFLGNKVKSGEVLYMALEDDPRRLQQRMMTIADEGTERLHITTSCVGKTLDDDICSFEREHPRCRLIVVDTFQKIRKAGREMSYSNDYSDVSRLKKLADDLGICILLVHHTRKMPDADCMNEISGTNGIAGSADTIMVLKKEKRTSRSAALYCTGRDIEDRELTLSLDRDTCIWQVKSDTLEEPDDSLPEELTELIAYMKEVGEFAGTNTEFCDAFCTARSYIIAPNALKRSMNLFRYELKENGVEFVSKRENGKRMIGVLYRQNENSDRGELTPEQRDPEPTATADVPESATTEPQAEHSYEEPALTADDIPDSGVKSALCRDEDYMSSLLGDSAYIPENNGGFKSMLSEIDLEEERGLWDGYR